MTLQSVLAGKYLDAEIVHVAFIDTDSQIGYSHTKQHSAILTY